MVFGDIIRLKDHLKNYKEKEILSKLGRFDSKTSKLLKNLEFLCIEIDEDTCIARRINGPLLNDYDQFYLPIEVMEVVEDKKQYTRLELQAHKDDSYEKGIERGIEEEKKFREDIVKESREEAFENGKVIGHESGYKEGVEETEKKVNDEEYQRGYEVCSKINKLEPEEPKSYLESGPRYHENYPHEFLKNMTKVMEEYGLILSYYNDKDEDVIKIECIK